MTAGAACVTSTVWGSVMIIPVVLAGGQGSQLWPLSREMSPKQFYRRGDQRSAFQATVARFKGDPRFSRPLVFCHEAQRFVVGEQLLAEGIVAQRIVLEPSARGSGRAAHVAALIAQQQGDPLVLLTSSDILVRDAIRLRDAVVSSASLADSGRVICFGITPAHQQAGLGFLLPRSGSGLVGGADAVSAFVRWPPAEQVAELCAAGWLWNGGMFLARASTLLQLLAPGGAAGSDAVGASLERASQDLDFLRLRPEPWHGLSRSLLDESLFEHTARMAVVPLSVGWSELGTWGAMPDRGEPDADGNVVEGDVVAVASRDCYVRAESRLVTTVGMEDTVVVETPDAVLVARRDRLGDLRELVQRLKSLNRPEVQHHRRVARPWGTYEGVDQADGYQVKRISVRPGASLSLQYHHHRSEHWVVVRGVARVTRGEQVIELKPNESTYIPIGMPHRLENPGVELLELIEVQCGSYLGEDDIVRIDDRYGRSTPTGQPG